MKTITNTAEIRQAIAELEGMQAQEWAVLKTHFTLVQESLKPGNLIKSALRDFITAEKQEEDTSLGIAAGYLAKKAVNGIVKTSLVKAAQFGLDALLSKKHHEEEAKSRFSLKGIVELLLSLGRNSRE